MKSFAVDTSVINSASPDPSWFDPRSGTASRFAAAVANCGSLAVTAAADSLDWMLVIDDATKAYPSPGTALRPRLLVLTDIGGDPDDQQSMVRLMTYSNEFDIEGLVATSRMGHGQDTMPELIEEIVSAYGQVRGNLNLHASGWPTEQYLMDRIKNGQGDQYSVGTGYDTEGSNHIISVVDANDPRPVWIAIWGGSRELRQALWRVTQDRSQPEIDAFVAKMRVYAIADQDGHGQWIMQQFPGLWYIHSTDFPGVDQSASFRGMYQNDTRRQNATNLGWRVAPAEYTAAEKDTWAQLVKTAWVNANVHGHGSLGDLYPTNVWQGPTGGSWPHNGPGGVKEGDTPTWFYILPNGLNVPGQPGFGGWGGRYKQDDPDRPLFTAAADPHDTAPTDQVLGQVWTVARWREHYQNDFAARMDWCVQASANANHHPLAVLNGDPGRGVLNLSVQAGAMVNLSAAGSTDPDGDALSYEWLYYKEAGSYGGALTINGATGPQASFTAPNVTSEKTIHIVLVVTDNGAPALTTYRRVVITVTPEGAGSIVSNQLDRI